MGSLYTDSYTKTFGCVGFIEEGLALMTIDRDLVSVSDGTKFGGVAGHSHLKNPDNDLYTVDLITNGVVFVQAEDGLAGDYHGIAYLSANGKVASSGTVIIGEVLEVNSSEPIVDQNGQKQLRKVARVNLDGRG